LAAVYEGLSRIRNDEIGVTIAYGLHWSCYGILHALITVTLFYYGSTLIKMTQKSFILSGVIPDGSRENNVQLRFFGARVPLACIGINFCIIQAEIHPSGLIDTIADLSSYYHSQSESNSSENP
ncbi:833_t:CDS:2, partial [Entrophospora sp. SA101]